jgi:hypothetical protein
VQSTKDDIKQLSRLIIVYLKVEVDMAELNTSQTRVIRESDHRDVFFITNQTGLKQENVQICY